MKLYYAPEACSLADHIALNEAGAVFDIERVDMHTKLTATGRDFCDINPKGYVPALVLDDGEVVTENVAVLDLIASRHPDLGGEGPLGRTRLLEALVFISTEIHRAFKPMWHSQDEADLQAARDTVADLLRFTAGKMQGGYMLGDRFTVSDCYLYVMLRWAERFGIPTPASLLRMRYRMEGLPSVQAALALERPAAA